MQGRPGHPEPPSAGRHGNGLIFAHFDAEDDHLDPATHFLSVVKVGHRYSSGGTVQDFLIISASTFRFNN